MDGKNGDKTVVRSSYIHNVAAYVGNLPMCIYMEREWEKEK